MLLGLTPTLQTTPRSGSGSKVWFGHRERGVVPLKSSWIRLLGVPTDLDAQAPISAAKQPSAPKSAGVAFSTAEETSKEH